MAIHRTWWKSRAREPITDEAENMPSEGWAKAKSLAVSLWHITAMINKLSFLFNSGFSRGICFDESYLTVKNGIFWKRVRIKKKYINHLGSQQKVHIYLSCTEISWLPIKTMNEIYMALHGSRPVFPKLSREGNIFNLWNSVHGI